MSVSLSRTPEKPNQPANPSTKQADRGELAVYSSYRDYSVIREPCCYISFHPGGRLKFTTVVILCDQIATYSYAV